MVTIFFMLAQGFPKRAGGHFSCGFMFGKSTEHGTFLDPVHEVYIPFTAYCQCVPDHYNRSNASAVCRTQKRKESCNVKKKNSGSFFSSYFSFVCVLLFFGSPGDQGLPTIFCGTPSYSEQPET